MTLQEMINLYEKMHPTWEWLIRTNDGHMPMSDGDPRIAEEPYLFYVCLSHHGVRFKAYGPTAEQAFSSALTLLPEKSDG